MSNTPSYVTNQDLLLLQQEVRDTSKILHELVPVVHNTAKSVLQLSETVGQLHTQVHKQAVPKGVGAGTIFSALAVLATWTIIVSTVIVQYINGSVTPIDYKVNTALKELKDHSTLPAHASALRDLGIMEERIRQLILQAERSTNREIDIYQELKQLRDQIDELYDTLKTNTVKDNMDTLFDIRQSIARLDSQLN